jgi:hypothetical protein
LPLRDVEWKFFVPPDRQYFGFGGNMDRQETAEGEPVLFTASSYVQNNLRFQDYNKRQAGQWMATGKKLMQEGKQKQAQEAFANTMNFSQGEMALNEDARVQLRNLQKQQLKIGLVNRRGSLRQAKNIEEGETPNLAAPQQAVEQFTQADVQRMEKRLTSKDNDALEVVADKIIDQQAAAAGVVNAIRVVMPMHGHPMVFNRSLQIDPNGDLRVKFWRRNGTTMHVLNALWPAAILFVAVWIWTARRREEAR